LLVKTEIQPQQAVFISIHYLRSYPTSVDQNYLHFRFNSLLLLFNYFQAVSAFCNITVNGQRAIIAVQFGMTALCSAMIKHNSAAVISEIIPAFCELKERYVNPEFS
jgi:hypothetical protein